MDVRISGILDSIVGRYASSSGSTWGVPGASASGVGSPDDGRGDGVAVGAGLAVGVGRGVGVAVGRGDRFTAAIWVGLGVGDIDGAGDLPGATVHAVTRNTVARTIDAIDRAFM